MIRIVLALAAVALIVIPTAPANADIAEEMSFLNEISSPRAAAMGECAINLVDGQTFIYNPGSMGIFHLNKWFSFHSTLDNQYRPEVEDGDRLKSIGFSIGRIDGLGHSIGSHRRMISMAAGYARLSNHINGQLYTHGRINPRLYPDIRRHDAKADYYFAALGLDYFVKVGIGGSYKEARSIDSLGTFWSRQTLTAYSYDFGIIAELPLKIFPQDSIIAESKGGVTSVEITPSIAYVDCNIGKNPIMKRWDSQGQLQSSTRYWFGLPRTQKFGASILGNVFKKNASFVSARISWEHDHDLVGEYNTKKLGAEVGFFGILFPRIGKISHESQDLYTTWGLGFELNGLIRWLYYSDNIHLNGWADRLLANASLSIDLAKYKDKNFDNQYYYMDYPLANSQFINISFSF